MAVTLRLYEVTGFRIEYVELIEDVTADVVVTGRLVVTALMVELLPELDCEADGATIEAGPLPTPTQ